MTMPFLEGLDEDLRKKLADRIQWAWAHHTTAIEGNSLPLSAVRIVLDEGRTVGGETMRELQEVVGHARAVKLLEGLVIAEGSQGFLDKTGLFGLHREVMFDPVVDLRKPIGAWRCGPDGQRGFHGFADPEHVNDLMLGFLSDLGQRLLIAPDMDRDELVREHARLHAGFLSVSPFADGNGRLARLISNLPLLKAGWVPIMIEKDRRAEYERLLLECRQACGPPTDETGMWPDRGALDRLTAFFADCHSMTLEWSQEARHAQAERDAKGSAHDSRAPCSSGSKGHSPSPG